MCLPLNQVSSKYLLKKKYHIFPEREYGYQKQRVKDFLFEVNDILESNSPLNQPQSHGGCLPVIAFFDAIVINR